MEQKIWFMSDPHYNHKNMCRATSTWANKETTTRDFRSISEMNDVMVKNINDCVDQNDMLYCLGDWSFGGIESIWQFRKRINCQIIHLITGNHDEKIKDDKLLPNCISNINGWFYDKPTVALDPTYNRNAFASEIFTSVQHYLEVVLNGRLFVLFHYPVEEWCEMNHGSIHLHGHVHHLYDKHETNVNFKRMDVGLDWKEFRPYSIEEIIHEMDKRPSKKHNS